MRVTPDSSRLDVAIDAAKVGSDATRDGPALKLAESILVRLQARRREAIVISDFQKTGWSGAEDVHFPDGMTLTPVSVGTPDTANLAVPSVTFARAAFSGQERITVTAGVTNKGSQPRQRRAGDARNRRPSNPDAERQRRRLRRNVRLLHAVHAGRAQRARHDTRRQPIRSPADNVFHFVLAPSQPLSVLVAGNGGRDDSTLYLSKALAIDSISRIPGGRDAGRAHRARAVRQALRRHPERRAVSTRGCWRRPQAVRRARGRPSRRHRRTRVVAGRRIGTAARDASAPRSIAHRAGAARSDFSTTATPCSKCSRRRAAAIFRAPASSATAPSSWVRPTASSPGSTTARLRPRNEK